MRRLFAVLLLAGCTGVPDGVTVVQRFEPERYLGTWYELARLDHRFERGLSHVTATYSRRDDGAIRVLNRGWSAEEGAWQEAEGVAKLNGEPGEGRLKVSFFGPFYGAYNIIRLDPDYRWALVVGPDRDYLWVLARDPALPPAQVDALLAEAAALGFPVDGIIRVPQGDPPP